MFCGIFVGACIIGGSINTGFKETLENYILNAIADGGHAYVYLFTFFLSGLVGAYCVVVGMRSNIADIIDEKRSTFDCFILQILRRFFDFLSSSNSCLHPSDIFH